MLGNVKIPSAPSVLLELHEIMQEDEPEFARVADVIECDIGISALVLKTVNSSLFGLRNKATSIRQATALLGLFQNAGDVLMMHRFPDYGPFLSNMRANDGDQAALEDERFSTNHAVVGISSPQPGNYRSTSSSSSCAITMPRPFSRKRMAASVCRAR